MVASSAAVGRLPSLARLQNGDLGRVPETGHAGTEVGGQLITAPRPTSDLTMLVTRLVDRIAD
jgi:hypothetical protein